MIRSSKSILRATLVFVGISFLRMGFASTPLVGHSEACGPVHEGSHDHAPANVHFIENQGQWDDAVLYRADPIGASAFLETGGITWAKLADEAYAAMHDAHMLTEAEKEALVFHGHAWRMRFAGGAVAQGVSGSHTASQYHNYFLGNDPTRWASRVPLHGELMYTGIWPGVDMRLKSQEGHLKYDLIVAAGADMGAIGLAYEGLDDMRLTTDGQLELVTSVGILTELRPEVYYGDGAGERIECEFQLEGSTVRFHFPDGYDAGRRVIIDPLLIASTLSGATGSSNYGHCATFDNEGNIYSGARNFGPSYPATPGAFQMNFGGGGTDISLSKYDPDGSTLLFATYLGGNSGENPHSLVVSDDLELCVLGSSSSPNYPTSPGAFQTFQGGTDIVVTRFTPDGTGIVGSTYVGGSGVDGTNNMWGNYGETYRGEIYVDANGNTIVASFSQSANFPTTAGAFQTALGGGQDGVVFSLDPTCTTLLWSTYLGGTGNDNAMGIRTTESGDIFVTGATESQNFPSTAGAFQTTYQGGARDGYVVRLSSNAGTMIAGTFFGTGEEDRPYFIDLDLNEDPWIYGQTTGFIGIFPPGTYGQVGGRIFISKFAGDLSALEVSSTFGPNSTYAVTPVAFLVDVCDNIYISGYGANSTLPLTSDNLYQNGSFYLAAFSENMQTMEYGTYYGGAHVDGGTSRFDKNGIVYQAVCTNAGFPTTPWAHATTQSIGWDVGVFKIDFQIAGVNAAGASTLNEGCAPITIEFSNNSTGTDWIWDFGDGSPPVNEFTPSHTYDTAGEFTVTLIAYDSLSCNLADTTYLPITIGEQQPITAAFTSEQTIDCDVSEVLLFNESTGEPLDWLWDMGDGTQYTDSNVVHNYSGPGDYLIQLIAYDPTGCSESDTLALEITVLPPDSVQADFSLIEEPGCDLMVVTTANNSTGPGPSYTWLMSDGTELTGTNVTHQFNGLGAHTVTLIAQDPNTCNLADTTSLDIEVLPSEPVVADFIAEQVFDCEDMIVNAENSSTGTNMVFLWDVGDGVQYTDTNLAHIFSGAGEYTITLTVSDALGCSPPDEMTMDLTIDPIIPVVADIQVEQTSDCSLLQVTGTNLSTGDSVSYSWDMGDGTILTDMDVVHNYAGPGSYTIVLTVTDEGCGSDDQASFTVQMINELPVALLGDTVVCPGETAVLVAGGSAGNYLWSTGETGAQIVIDGGGTYSLTVTLDNCTGTAEAEIVQGPTYDLGYEVDACPNEAIGLSIPLEGLSYSWSTGGNGRTEQVLGQGTYTFTVEDMYGCFHTDSVVVRPLDSEPQIFAPNAFTPDGDGVNDTFAILGFGERQVEMSIFNRWGELLYVTNSMHQPWDGTYNGTPVKNGVYVYKLEYDGICNAEMRKVMGHVTVVR